MKVTKSHTNGPLTLFVASLGSEIRLVLVIFKFQVYCRYNFKEFELVAPRTTSGQPFCKNCSPAPNEVVLSSLIFSKNRCSGMINESMAKYSGSNRRCLPQHCLPCMKKLRQKVSVHGTIFSPHSKAKVFQRGEGNTPLPSPGRRSVKP